MLNNCVSCNIETTKYKCPSCFAFYCSLECCKQHKQNPCEPPKPNHIEKTTESNDGNSKLSAPFPTDDTVDPIKLLDLDNSDHLKRLLDNPHLRKIIMEIDSAPNARRAMDAAMLEPLFLELADECLKIVDPHCSNIEKVNE